MILARTQRKGFTLIEMLIVGALIVLFAGLALIAAQQVYEDSKRKAVYDETHQIMTALGIARNDLGFYPRIYLLGMPMALVLYQQGTGPFYVRPSMDTYGYYSSGLNTFVNYQVNPIYTVTKNWKAPYSSVSEARSAGGGGWKSGIVKVRLSDAEHRNFRSPTGEDLSLVIWPADTYGTPYAFYQIKSDHSKMTTTNPRGLRFIYNPTEESDYFTAVVSYGPNGVPGGFDTNNKPPNVTLQDPNGYPDQSLFIKGDMVAGGQADFTLRSVSGSGTMQESINGKTYTVNVKLDLTPNSTALTALINSFTNTNKNNPGITDSGSDDIIAKY